ncbi:hypothetical protein [Halomonas sp. CKK8]|uniref:hypothetical protein n=1 Tax=Halomonas sp. CKK8 TaxID=3036127 RepID=UPI00241577F3|nr:hypothetical protein [Halomonas sp. CKK8]WFM71820.1 hypothetical protein P8934_02185 [Halomonas sp. CKK8]
MIIKKSEIESYLYGFFGRLFALITIILVVVGIIVHIGIFVSFIASLFFAFSYWNFLWWVLAHIAWELLVDAIILALLFLLRLFQWLFSGE